MKKWLFVTSIVFNIACIIALGLSFTLIQEALDKRNARLQSHYQDLQRSQTDILFLGDSITEGAIWQELLNRPTLRIINRGISGNTTNDILKRLDSIYPLKPKRIFLMVGVNDINAGIPQAQSLKNYHQILDGLQQALPNTELVMQSLLPTNSDWPFADSQLIPTFNKALRQIAAQRQLKYLDLFPAFANQQQQLCKTFSNDGIHLMGNGYRRWQSILTPYIDDLDNANPNKTPQQWHCPSS